MSRIRYCAGCGARIGRGDRAVPGPDGHVCDDCATDYAPDQ